MLTKEQKSMLHAAYAADVWPGDESMADYCTNRAAALAELPNGELIPVEKRKIETHFCFGESGYDYDEAQDAAARARTSEDYFRSENMAAFRDMLEQIEKQYALHAAEPSLPYSVLLICERSYADQPETSRLKALETMRAGELLEALGGSAYVRDLPGKRFAQYGSPLRVPTLDELNAIKAAATQAAKEHEKKVNAYLKRYGLSQVHAWTYWRDA